ncbi:hypothetical protein DPV78_004150 [Talaromyces pinophilus]|nr:hypothetical protein DPV78_004150 [Talaromyces pinophilus]
MEGSTASALRPEAGQESLESPSGSFPVGHSDSCSVAAPAAIAIIRMLRPISTPVRTSKHLPFNKRRTQYSSAETATIRIYKSTILVHLRSQCPPPAARRHLEKAALGSAVRVPGRQSVNQSTYARRNRA